MQDVLLKSPLLFAVCGFESSGKNTVSELLEKQFGFVCWSFADIFKMSVAAVFGWEYELLLGITAESREWRKQVDEYWSMELDIPGLTPRKILQYSRGALHSRVIGTDVMRVYSNDCIWIKSLKKKIVGLLKQGRHVVITDCRFPNEVQVIKDLGGRVILVSRESTVPAWIHLYHQERHALARLLQASSKFFNETVCENLYTKHQVHPAESSLIEYRGYDYTIYNNGTIHDLEDKVLLLALKYGARQLTAFKM